MHPCRHNENQLESVTFQSSVCALIQAKKEFINVNCSEELVDRYKAQKLFLFSEKTGDLLEFLSFDDVGKILIKPLEEIFFVGNRPNDCKSHSNAKDTHLKKGGESDEYFEFKFDNGSGSFIPNGEESIWIQECGKPEKFKYKTHINSSLFVLDVYKKSLIEVYENDFNRRILPCFEYKSWKIKFIGNRNQAKEIINQMRSKVSNKQQQNFNRESNFKAEGIINTLNAVKDNFTDFLGGMSTIFEAITCLGKTKRVVNEKYTSFMDRIRTPLASSEIVPLLEKYGVGLLKILISVLSFISAGFSVLHLSRLVLEIYCLFSDSISWQSESLETVLVAGISSILPSSLSAIIKKMTLLTNKKLFDDSNFIFDFFTTISQLMKNLISFLPEKIQTHMSFLLDLFGLSEFLYIQRAKNIICEFHKDRHIMLVDDFRTRVKKLEEEFKAIDLKKFFARNKPLQDICSEFTRIFKGVVSYEQTSRPEPCCFVFQGPPGCRKSVTVTRLISVLGLTHYAHLIKGAEDGKDHYDSYNNEDIFNMDDIGQMSKSQWRFLINWVSAMKLPLECAEASLKGTKYFNSDLIFLTTNCFTNLQGFTAKDCIETPEALWRRGYVFDFEEVRGVGPDMKGIIKFKYYDIVTKQFVNDFPEDFKKFLVNEEEDLLPSCDTENQTDLLVWLSTVVMGFKKMKKSQYSNNSLRSEDIEFIRLNNPFHAQVEEEELPCINNLNMEFIVKQEVLVESYFDYMLGICKDLFADFLSILPNFAITNFDFKKEVGIISVAMFLGILVTSLVYHVKNFVKEGGMVSLNTVENVKNIADNFDSLDFKMMHSLLPKISSQMFEIDMTYVEKGVVHVIKCHSLISGRKILVPYHLVLDRVMQITIYGDRNKNYRIVDHSPVSVVYVNIDNDVAVVSLSDGYPSPFPKLASCFQPCYDQVVGIVFPEKIIKLEGILLDINSVGPIVYPIGTINNKIEDPVAYKDLHFAGMCGTLLVTSQGMLVGMHVAGHDSKSIGASLKWSRKCREDLFDVFSSVDNGLKITAPISKKVYENCSALKIDTDLNVYVPKNSNFIKTGLHDVFENTRKPANLSVYGSHTVKDVSKSSRCEIGPVDHEELDFAGKVLDLYFENFDDLSEKEIVKGDDMLAPINKKSSNGIFPIKGKKECFDFDEGVFKEDFRVLYDDFEKRMETGDVEVKHIAWFETLKDELRNNEKKDPRSYRVSPVTMQVLTKKCFGKMVKKIVKDRWFNEIMIGINPFSEWPQLYNRMQGGRCWGGDIGKYDKCMRVQVQIKVAETILKYYK